MGIFEHNLSKFCGNLFGKKNSFYKTSIFVNITLNSWVDSVYPTLDLDIIRFNLEKSHFSKVFYFQNSSSYKPLQKCKIEKFLIFKFAYYFKYFEVFKGSLLSFKNKLPLKRDFFLSRSWLYLNLIRITWSI